MDPNACLKEIRELVANSFRGNGFDGFDADRLADLIDGLDQWISKGGFLPADWQKYVDCVGKKEQSK